MPLIASPPLLAHIWSLTPIGSLIPRRPVAPHRLVALAGTRLEFDSDRESDSQKMTEDTKALKVVGAGPRAPIPEPAAKPHQPEFCHVGFPRKMCGTPTHMTWNAAVGYWCLTCSTDTTAAGLHIGWKWPEESEWTWCSDYRRQKCTKKPPRAPRADAPAISEPAAAEPLETVLQASLPATLGHAGANAAVTLQHPVSEPAEAEAMETEPATAAVTLQHPVSEPAAAEALETEPATAKPDWKRIPIVPTSWLRTEPLAARLQRKRRHMPPTFGHAGANAAVEAPPQSPGLPQPSSLPALPPPSHPPPPLPPPSLVTRLAALNQLAPVLDHLDYQTQSSLAAAAVPLKASRQIAFRELPFTQHDFPWAFTRGGQEVETSAACTPISLAAAVAFYGTPEPFTRAWQDEDKWRSIFAQGAIWHEEYVRSRTLAVCFDALGAEGLHVSPDEVYAQAHTLTAAFAPLALLQGERAMTCITDICEVCKCYGPIGETSCPCGGRRPRGRLASLQECLKSVSSHVRAMAPEPCAFVVTAGPRSFYIGVAGGVYVVGDSHYRSWTGKVRESSLVLSGKWVDRADFHSLLGEAIGRGELGYNSPEALTAGTLFSWLQVGSGARHGTGTEDTNTPQITDRDRSLTPALESDSHPII